MTHTPNTPTEGDLRVWHIPQVPMPAFYVSVSTVDEGFHLCNVLADYDDFQRRHNVKPDYCNANGVQRFETDGEGGFDWYDVDLDDEQESQS